MKVPHGGTACASHSIPDTRISASEYSGTFGKARAVIFSDGTPWFVAKDVCEGLGLHVAGTGVTPHVRRLKPEQKMTIHGALISNQGVHDALFRGKQGAQVLLDSVPRRGVGAPSLGEVRA